MWSIVLFVSGGVIGIFINGANVRIPAHYHGCIVGVTLALMGLAYHLLPQLGYGTADSRMAALQPALYGLGQLMHIIRPGLVRRLWRAAQGGRCRPGTALSGEIAGMGLMGLGGLVAIVGGLLFVIVMLRALGSRSAAPGIGDRA